MHMRLRKTRMLILTRCRGQQICINDDIKIKILGFTQHQVRIGIEAPLHHIIHREEVYLLDKNKSSDATLKAQEALRAEEADC